jgi:hypothetical protein
VFSRIRVCLLAVVFSIGVESVALSADFVVTLYRLPPGVRRITDDIVTVRVYAIDDQGSAGRDGNVRIPNGKPILAEELLPAKGVDGRFRIRVPAIPGQTTQFVNIEFERQGATTQILSGVVAEEGEPYRLDVVVPEPLKDNVECCRGRRILGRFRCGN